MKNFWDKKPSHKRKKISIWLLKQKFTLLRPSNSEKKFAFGTLFPSSYKAKGSNLNGLHVCDFQLPACHRLTVTACIKAIWQTGCNSTCGHCICNGSDHRQQSIRRENLKSPSWDNKNFSKHGLRHLGWILAMWQSHSDLSAKLS